MLHFSIVNFSSPNIFCRHSCLLQVIECLHGFYIKLQPLSPQSHVSETGEGRVTRSLLQEISEDALKPKAMLVWIFLQAENATSDFLLNSYRQDQHAMALMCT